MTMPATTWIVRTSLIALGLFGLAAFVAAQPTKLPNAEEVKALQAKYRAEHDKIVKEGIAKRFLPAIMDKADELAKKSDTALAAGRLSQASEAIRQARWQLPYQPIGLPDNISRVIGNLRLRHSGEINAIAFSPDGAYIATAGSDGLVKVWDLGNGHELFACVGHKDKVRGLAWSLDGKILASGGAEKNIKIWDAKTGKQMQNIEAVGGEVNSLVLSKDGKHVFTGQQQSPGKDVKAFTGLFVNETATGKLVRDVRDFPNKIDAIALSNDGTLLATGDANGNTRLWQYPSFIDNVNQPAYWTQQDPTGATYHLAFSPDDKTLVRSSPFSVKFYATPLPGAPFQVGAARATINAVHPERYVCSAFSKDGKTLYLGTSLGNIQFFDPDNLAQKTGEYKGAHNLHINSLVFSPDGNLLASCSGDFIVRLWDFDIVLQSRDFEGHEAPVWTAAFNPDATRLISASADRTVKVWERDTGKVQFTITDHTAPVTVAQFSPDGKLIASAGGDKVIRIFDASTGKPLRTCEGHQGTITFLDFSFDSKRIVSGSADRRIKIWDADTGKEKLSINDNPSIVAGVVFSPNGKQIAVANIDQTIRLYDADAGKLQHSWNAHGTAVNGVAYSPDGQWLASCGADMAVVVWPLAKPGADSIRLIGHSGPVSMVAFRKDNQHLVSCGADQLVKLWKIERKTDVYEGKEVQTFRGHKDWVTAVAFSKDGYHVVSSSVDRRLKIWEITSRELPLLAEHTGTVESVAVSPDGTLIATGSSDRTIKIWDRKTGAEIATLTGHTSAVMALVFTPDSKQLVSSGHEASIRLWQVSPPREIVRTPQQMRIFSKLRHHSSYIALDPEGKKLFVWLPKDEAVVKTIVEVLNLPAGEVFYEFMETNSKINCCAFSGNGKLVATGLAKDGAVRIRTLGEKAATMLPGGDWFLFDKGTAEKPVGVADLAITPDGNTLIAGSTEGQIKIANIQKREVHKTTKAHQAGIVSLIVSPDGKAFATIGSDNVIKAWSIDGTELRRWDLGKNQGMFVVNLAFTPDGKHLVTANANTTVYILDLP